MIRSIRYIPLLVWWPLITISTIGCEQTARTPVDIGSVEEDGLVEESWDVVFRISLDGNPRVEVEAGYMARYVFEDSTYTRLVPAPEAATDSVTAHFYDTDGQPSANLTAAEIIYFDEQRRFRAIGRVVVETEEGKRLETEQLQWDEADRQVTTDGFVRIITTTEQLQGYRLIADENLDRYEISRITGQITFEDE